LGVPEESGGSIGKGTFVTCSDWSQDAGCPRGGEMALGEVALFSGGQSCRGLTGEGCHMTALGAAKGIVLSVLREDLGRTSQ